jgi:hypothetical protein
MDAAGEKLIGKEVMPWSYPLYKQCDPRWGNNTMVTSTICQVGCLMSSISMALHGRNLTISGEQSDPAVLNLWLQQNQGYDNENGM